MNLTMLERIKLLELLPGPGRTDSLDRKISRKLEEALSFSEAERELLIVRYLYACPYEERSPEGRVTRCDKKGFFSGPPQCEDHNVEMIRENRMEITMTPDVEAMGKNIHMGPRALAICTEALKPWRDRGQITDMALESLCDKFFPLTVEELEELSREIETLSHE